jgi:hypothetical protein
MAESQSTVIYRAVPGFDRYRVGDDGSVWARTRAGGWYRLKPRCQDEYARVVLYARGSRRHVSVHRLVLEAFVGPCPAGMEACHGDGDRSNNRLGNLRWDTPKNNAADTIAHGRRARGSCHRDAKLSEADIPAIVAAVAGGESVASVAARYGVFHTTVLGIVRGEKWRHVPGPRLPRLFRKPPKGSGLCYRGHKQNEANTYYRQTGPRKGHAAYCRVCRRELEVQDQRSGVHEASDRVREVALLVGRALPINANPAC